jgi:hypothetical protein
VGKKLESSKLIADELALPDAPIYVIARDGFMSGWGESRNRPNYVILPCASQHEAAAVLGFVQRRREMHDARITNKAGLALSHANTYSLFSRETAPAWYPEASHGTA